MISNLISKLRKSKPPGKPSLLLGEPAYNVEKAELLIGNPKSEKGYDVVAKVYTGPDNCLYAKLENHDYLIPIGRLA